MGALNMYSTTRVEIAAAAPLIAKTLAAQIASVLSSSREIQNLHDALNTRTAIGTAIGLLMAKYGLTEAAALNLLKRRSSHANLKVRVIAARIVAEHDTAGRELPPVSIC
jgi:AmiR/NasT family two-component response regulator